MPKLYQCHFMIVWAVVVFMSLLQCHIILGLQCNVVFMSLFTVSYPEPGHTDGCQVGECRTKRRWQRMEPCCRGRQWVLSCLALPNKFLLTVAIELLSWAKARTNLKKDYFPFITCCFAVGPFLACKSVVKVWYHRKIASSHSCSEYGAVWIFHSTQGLSGPRLC